MELWIRSQDKSNLKKVNNIYVEEIEKDFDSWVGNIYSRPYVITSDEGNLGFYATKERALEVLDDIQKGLSSDFTFNGTHEQADILIKTKMINGLYGVIYEMPKD